MTRTKYSFTHQHTKIKYNKHVRNMLKRKSLKRDDLTYVQEVMGYGKIKPKQEDAEVEDAS